VVQEALIVVVNHTVAVAEVAVLVVAALIVLLVSAVTMAIKAVVGNCTLSSKMNINHSDLFQNGFFISSFYKLL
jgi:hypothetical protein